MQSNKKQFIVMINGGGEKKKPHKEKNPGKIKIS